MTLTKVVDGERVEMTPEEEQAMLDERNSHPTSDEWLARIATERERRLDTSITVTLSGGDYAIPVTDRSLALAPAAEQEAREDASMMPFPTDKGIIDFGEADLHMIRKTLAAHAKGVYVRERELQAKVADGTITEADIAEGWP